MFWETRSRFNAIYPGRPCSLLQRNKLNPFSFKTKHIHLPKIQIRNRVAEHGWYRATKVDLTTVTMWRMYGMPYIRDRYGGSARVSRLGLR